MSHSISNIYNFRIIEAVQPRKINFCCVTRNSSVSVMGGSIVHFGEMNKRPTNSRLYSARDERWPISADVVLGKAGEAFKGIGERSIASSSGGSCSKVFTGSPAFLHSSANTYGQWHAGHIEIRLRRSRVCYFFFFLPYTRRALTEFF